MEGQREIAVEAEWILTFGGLPSLTWLLEILFSFLLIFFFEQEIPVLFSYYPLTFHFFMQVDNICSLLVKPELYYITLT